MALAPFIIFNTICVLHIAKVEMLQEMFPNKDVPEINASLEESGGDLEEAVTGLLSPKEATSNEGIKELSHNHK